MLKLLFSVIASSALALSFGAGATTLDASQIVSGASAPLTFSATGGSLKTKTLNGVTGVGVSGGHAGAEIDQDGESITASSENGFTLGSVTLAFLFDGPEYNDPQEIAVMSATRTDGTTSEARLTNDYSSPLDTQASLTIDGIANNGLIQSVSQATSSVASEITLGALFGNSQLSDFTFTAESGPCGAGACTDMADYSIESISTAVPGPGELSMMLFGALLIGVGAIARRRQV